MVITEKDVGRKVVSRVGEVLTIISFIDEAYYPVRCIQDFSKGWVSYTTSGRFCKSGTKEFDLVKFIEEPVKKESNGLSITKEDVGRVVSLRNGDTTTIQSFEKESSYRFPVHLTNGQYVAEDGSSFTATNPTDRDVVAFVDVPFNEQIVFETSEKTKVEFTIPTNCDSMVLEVNGYKITVDKK